MNILTEPLQAALLIDGKSYPIKTDFRVWLKFCEIWEQGQFNLETAVEVICLCFDSKTCPELPKGVARLLTGLLEFYTGEVFDSSKENEKKSTGSAKRVVSFTDDAEYIFAAFMQQYGIDLESVPYMHWHKFRALFRGLNEDCKLMKIIEYRSINTSEIKDGDMRKFYCKMQNLYALPDTRSEEERERDFTNELSKMF